MIDWFEWNGVRCTDYGMHVLEQPSPVIPNERVSTVNIPGRSGSLLLTEGKDVYEDLNLSCTAVIDDPYFVDNGQTKSRIALIAGWLKGSGTVTFANRQEGFYKARISNQIPFQKVVRGNPHMTFSVQFRCEPYLYLHSGAETTTYSNSHTILTNPGNVASAPLIKVYGNAEGSITFTGETELPAMYIENFTDIDYIILDCESKIAYKGSNSDPLDPLTLLGTRVSGDWLTIPTGEVIMDLSGGITSVELTPRWRCI